MPPPPGSAERPDKCLIRNPVGNRKSHRKGGSQDGAALTGKIWKFLIFWWWLRVSTYAFGLLWLSRTRKSLRREGGRQRGTHRQPARWLLRNQRPGSLSPKSKRSRAVQGAREGREEAGRPQAGWARERPRGLKGPARPPSHVGIPPRPTDEARQSGRTAPGSPGPHRVPRGRRGPQDRAGGPPASASLGNSSATRAVPVLGEHRPFVAERNGPPGLAHIPPRLGKCVPTEAATPGAGRRARADRDSRVEKRALICPWTVACPSVPETWQ